MEKDLLCQTVKDALDELYKNDLYLISNENEGYKYVSERGIVFRFGIYFDKLVNERFPEYNVDSEYNRNNGEKKILPNRRNGAFPDIIVHKRGSNTDNLLVIEFKTWWNPDTREDEGKIREFCNKKGVYKFYMGAVIVLGRTRGDVEINYFE